ncbi:hypothetical protein AB1Y20_004619 [Prymnesium parvum]|uniref:Uncharacterized protein n=1 Tax=Prymnesium parvum TaxID=97485 RepID=A0AB34IZS3_PRYPA
MAAFSFSQELGSVDTSSSWRLQSKKRATPSSPSLLSTGGFAAWTNVPPVGVPDPHIQDQMRRGRASGPTLSSRMSVNPVDSQGGKRITTLSEHPAKIDSKRHFPHLANVTSSKEQVSRGIKQVHTPAKGIAATGSNPNSVARESHRESNQRVRMFPGRNDVAYNCWEPADLHKASNGDWNLNTKYGFRKVSMSESGEPKRSLEHPVAWPSFKGYPPDKDARSGVRIDYALERYGGIFRSMPPPHPDLVASRANRASASDPSRCNQSLQCRNPAY